MVLLSKRKNRVYGITEEAIHALVGYGMNGTREVIWDFKCQACGKKLTALRNESRIWL
jgi:hypothetical protein